MSTKPTPDCLSVEQLKEVRAAITWGDSRKAAKLAREDEDDGAVTAHAFHRAAVRMGIGAASYDDFLDQVTMQDLNAALEDGDETPTNGGRA